MNTLGQATGGVEGRAGGEGLQARGWASAAGSGARVLVSAGPPTPEIRASPHKHGSCMELHVPEIHMLKS